MNISRRIALGGAALWFNRGLTIAMALVLMPVLFRRLPGEELGLWLLLGQTWAVMGVLDFGVGAVLTRRIALAKGKSGSDPDAPLSVESQSEIADLVAMGQRIYRVLSVCTFVVAWASGLVYLNALDLHSVPYQTVLAAWTILCASHAINLWSTVWTCVLEGVGYVGWEALIMTAAAAGTTLTQIAVLAFGGGLVALAAVAATGALLQRTFLRLLARRRRPELFHVDGRWRRDVAGGLAQSAWRAWATMLGGVLVQNTDALFIAAAAGATSVPAYRAAFLLVLNINMLAGVFGSASAPYVSHLWQANDFDEVRRIVRRNLRIGLTMLAAGAAAVLASGDALFTAWLGPGHYAGWHLVAVFAVLFFLEQQNHLIMTACRATGREPFAFWTMAGGLLKLGLAYVLVGRIGLIGVPIGTILGQLVTAYWYVPYEGLSRLGIGARAYVMEVLAPAAAVFAGALAAGVVVSDALPVQAVWPRVIAATASSGLVFAAAFWLLALEPRQRQQIAAAFLPAPSAPSNDVPTSPAL